MAEEGSDFSDHAADAIETSPLEDGEELDEFSGETAAIEAAQARDARRGRQMLRNALGAGEEAAASGSGSDSDSSVAEEDSDEDGPDAPAAAPALLGAMAIKPFLGTVKHSRPSKLPPRPEVPEQELVLEHVSGYRCRGTRNNVHSLATNEVVYAAGAVGVIADPMSTTNAQRFLQGHTDDVLCVAVDPSGKLIATGEIGAKPAIRVWEAASGRCLTVIKGDHRRAIVALAFSPDGTQLASVGDDPKHHLIVYNSDGEGGPLINTPCDTGRVLTVAWNPYETGSYTIVTGGIKHLKFWSTNAHGKFHGKAAAFGGARASVISLAFTPTGLWAGDAGGNIHIFTSSNTPHRTIKKAHAGPVYALASNSVGVASGGRDGKLITWNDRGKPVSAHQIAPAPAKGSKHPTGVSAITWTGDDVIAGTNRGEVVLVTGGEDSADVSVHPITEGHYDGEAWGLAVSPDGSMIATSGDDNSVRVWAADNMAQLAMRRVSKRPSKTARMLGASTMSSYSPNQASRGVAWSPDGEHIAIGVNDGSVQVLAAGVDSRSDVPSLAPISTLSDATQWVEVLAYSPDGRYLAVGSHDNKVYVYEVDSGYTLVATCSGPSSFISQLDWLADSSAIRILTGAYELLFYEVPTGMQLTDGASLFRDAEWASTTNPITWPTQGIWPGKSGFKGADLSDIDTCAANPAVNLLAVGDDFGKVSLFEYPAYTKSAPSKRYGAHSSHVKRVRWSPGGSTLYTVGGNDCCLMKWSLTGPRGTVPNEAAGVRAALERAEAAASGPAASSSTRIGHVRHGGGSTKARQARNIPDGTAARYAREKKTKTKARRAGAGAGAGSRAAAPPPPPPDAGEWLEAEDPTSGRKYLYHSITRETRWA